MEKMYRDRVCSSKAQISDSRFSYSCSMLDLPWHALRYRLAGWSPGTALEQRHGLALANATVHRPLYSNMAAVGGQYTEFYGGFMFVQRVL